MIYCYFLCYFRRAKLFLKSTQKFTLKQKLELNKRKSKKVKKMPRSKWKGLRLWLRQLRLMIKIAKVFYWFHFHSFKSYEVTKVQAHIFFNRREVISLEMRSAEKLDRRLLQKILRITRRKIKTTKKTGTAKRMAQKNQLSNVMAQWSSLHRWDHILFFLHMDNLRCFYFISLTNRWRFRKVKSFWKKRGTR